ncbi:hypothetical protein HMPREF1991_03201 [Hoylesella loescheii DSM 19665 = JCM 12249 = ATCC 15930]|uniref:Uncharacterized protein n=1 Tax=Hoylesella loescheii DSM 19665 = JCM 12249 = ATCC 15930 TaxID=1122985 RepID=A0A069QFI9_HOYLO|nr:hypothetical protein HMPREF1991_03201 [Hoylesella loescheii DSM 19665 = JCM 12249 = ATCC 15930]
MCIFQNAYGDGTNIVTRQKVYQMRIMQIERQREDHYANIKYDGILLGKA